METVRFSGMTAIVTGAAQGLGASYALAFARQGASVVICDVLNTGSTAEAVRAVGGKCLEQTVDITNGAQVKAMVDRAVDAFGCVDVLVNNAAISGDLVGRPFTDISSESFERVLSVNIRGTFECAKAVVPHMRRKGYGKIINTSSGTAFKGSPGIMHYVASKGAVLSMTKAMARELGDYGIRVNCVAPGLTKTESISVNPSWTEEATSANVSTRALKREAYADDVVGAVLFLASRESDFVTGQTIVVDGGSYML